MTKEQSIETISWHGRFWVPKDAYTALLAERYQLPEKLEFMECDTCRAKPGMPRLCAGCLHNRALIHRFRAALQEIARSALNNTADEPPAKCDPNGPGHGTSGGRCPICGSN